MSVASEYTLVSAWRKISLVGGMLSILLGLVILLWPNLTALVLTALIGVWLLVLGVARFIDSFGRRSTGHALTGVIYIFGGALVLANLDASLRFVAVMVGAAWICAGLSEAVAGISRIGGTWVRRAAIGTGLINITLGALVIFLPGVSVLVLAEVAAVWLILLGVLQLYASLRARRSERALIGRPS